MTGSKNDRSRGYFLSAGVEGLFVFDDLIFSNLTRTGCCLKEITCKAVKFCMSEKKNQKQNERKAEAIYLGFRALAVKNQNPYRSSFL